MRLPKATIKKVYPDGNGVEHDTIEAWQKAQIAIAKRDFHDEFVQSIKELPSVKACCTRTGINDMTAENLLRLIVQDMNGIRSICRKMAPKGEKLGVVNKENSLIWK